MTKDINVLPQEIEVIEELKPTVAKKTTTENKPTISKTEFDRRIKLDVANSEYINPSLDHFIVK